MPALGRLNNNEISLGSTSGIFESEPEVNRPYPVIVATRQTQTAIQIDIDWYVDEQLHEVSGAEASDLLITGTAQSLTPTVTPR